VLALNDVRSVTFKETAKIVARVEPDRGRAQHSECHVYLKVSRPFQLRAHECIGPKGEPRLIQTVTRQDNPGARGTFQTLDSWPAPSAAAELALERSMSLSVRRSMDAQTKREIWLLALGTALVELPVAFAAFTILSH
jgi:hypothetical protein